MNALFAAFGVDWHLLLIQLVNFALLLGVLTYFLYKPILRIIDERQAKIAEGVRTANEANKKLEDAKTQGEQMVGDAGKQAESLVATARARATELNVQAQKSAQEKAAAILKDAEAKAEEEKRQAMLESEREIARAAMLAAEKILGKKNS